MSCLGLAHVAEARGRPPPPSPPPRDADAASLGLVPSSGGEE